VLFQHMVNCNRSVDPCCWLAAKALAGQADIGVPGASMLPAVENLRAFSATAAVAVLRAAVNDGVATGKLDNLVQAVQDAILRLPTPTR
jgi:malic enzyme